MALCSAYEGWMDDSPTVFHRSIGHQEKSETSLRYADDFKFLDHQLFFNIRIETSLRYADDFIEVC